VAGTANTGGGGGGNERGGSGVGAAGGSGFVILRHAKTYANAAVAGAGASIKQDGTYTYYLFISTGTIQF
jgi:hypothetical protein